MPKTVFNSHSEVAHVWAQNSEETGRSDGRLYFDGPALFSYGPHYLAGFIMPDGVALLNEDSYSVSTSKHKNHAFRAVLHRTRHFLPGLTELRHDLNYLAAAQGDSRVSSGRRPADVRQSVRAWAVDTLTKGDLAPDSDGLAYLLKAAGLGRSVAAIRREAEKRARREAQDNARREERAREGEARRLSDGMTDSEFRAEVRGLATRTYDSESRLKTLNRNLLNAQKWANGRKGWKVRHATLKARRAYVRATLADLDRRQARAAAIQETRNAIQVLRVLRGGSEANLHGRIPGAAIGSGSPLHSPDARNPDPEADRGERFAILAAQTLAILACSPIGIPPDLRARITAAAEAAQAPASAARETRQARITAAAEAREAARLERERADREAWLRGDSVRFYGRDAQGGAYLRAVRVERDESGEITGGVLQTSQGAEVPLPHAIRAFRFLKWCRETGREWNRNGRTLRVGFYQVDYVGPEGDFRAGCHFIRWAEVARVAMRLGVADLAAQDVTENKGVAA